MTEVIDFIKYQGCGNDYIYIDCFKKTYDDMGGISKALSDRHFSIGGDGVIFIKESTSADCEMRMFNADGSEGKMCGNAIRCVAKFMYDKKGVKNRTILISTLSGIKEVCPIIQNGEFIAASVNMGKAVFSPQKIPVKSDLMLIDAPIIIGEKEVRLTALSVGNPHAVIFTNQIPSDISVLGRLIENHPMFPERVNVEFVKIISGDTVKMRVWERGSGETYACGTGACAAVAAADKCGLIKADKIKVQLLGGNLFVKLTNEGILLSGDATEVFNGSITIKT